VALRRTDFLRLVPLYVMLSGASTPVFTARRDDLRRPP